MLCKLLTGVLALDHGQITRPLWTAELKRTAHTPASAGAASHSTGDNEELLAKIRVLTAEIERSRREAFEQGTRAGEAAVRTSLEGELRNSVNTLAAHLTDLAEQRPKTIRRAENDTVRLALEISRRVLHREITIDPTALSALVRAALEKLSDQEIYSARVHPDLEGMVRASLKQAGRSDGIQIVADPSLARGAVTFEFSRGSLDASVDTQLREIERGLVDDLKPRS